MKDDEKLPNSAPETVVKHSQLNRDRAIALFLVRNHAHRHGKPPPDPASIGPVVMTRMKPRMSREQMVERLIAAFEQRGIKVNRDK